MLTLPLYYSKKQTMIQLLTGKIILVTGASRGIGRSIALEMARNGASVAFTYLSSQEKAMALQNELTAMGVKAKAYQSDAANFEQTQALVSAVLADFGQLDVVVNNAGITRDGLLLRMSEAHWQEVLNTNLTSCFNLAKACTPSMLKAKSGSIINIASVVGIKGNAGQANYAASKAGIIGFSKSLALELGSRNIRCNVVAPGFIETEMTESLDAKVIEEWNKGIPLKRAGKPEEVAKACVFLASDMSSYITGQVLQVCGGILT
jgi:3-oxoacyl-[acyl-carrier protein] reductase